MTANTTETIKTLPDGSTITLNTRHNEYALHAPDGQTIATAHGTGSMYAVNLGDPDSGPRKFVGLVSAASSAVAALTHLAPNA